MYCEAEINYHNTTKYFHLNKTTNKFPSHLFGSCLPKRTNYNLPYLENLTFSVLVYIKKRKAGDFEDVDKYDENVTYLCMEVAEA